MGLVFKVLDYSDYRVGGPYTILIESWTCCRVTGHSDDSFDGSDANVVAVVIAVADDDDDDDDDEVMLILMGMMRTRRRRRRGGGGC